MAAVGALGEHGLVYTYQAPDPDSPQSTIAWAVISSDAKTWSAPLKITDSSTNVHDTAALARPDGGADLYYEYSTDDFPFSIYRRCISPDGTWGPEQRVTDSSVKDAMKPSPSRLADGTVLLTFATGVERDATTGFPIKQRIEAVVLPGDAPSL